MKIIISSDSVKFPLTGIGRYTYELIMAFQELDTFAEIKFLNGYSVVDKLNYNHGIDPANLNQSLKAKFIGLLRNSQLADIYRILSPFLKSNALSSYSDYIFHGTNFFVPAFKGKSISTFHDLSPFIMPQCIETKRRKYLQKQLIETSKNATFFITDTLHTKKELVNYFGISENKVRAVHLACDPIFQIRQENQVVEVLKKYALNYKNFTLCVCTIEPRKNLDVLLNAYNLLPNSIKFRFPLVLVGHEGWCSENTHAKIKRFVNEGWLKYLSFVHNNELPLIYSSARLFVFPSLYEGFGLPILEAMSSGVPVISSNASCLPEVAGDAALFFEPSDIDGLNNYLYETLENDEILRNLNHLGLKRAANFSWQRCAVETLEVYKTVEKL